MKVTLDIRRKKDRKAERSGGNLYFPGTNYSILILCLPELRSLVFTMYQSVIKSNKYIVIAL
ncbi:hypothetical protein GFO_2987 [Christiangramia forsetii KT0803]|uniref:Uncharacterized protein n=1 Tax=Christiangramia forsetii (strain DSM 17595 / CGMCC 1.15422 / KT0803) TaxID=411154 RepID=A0M5N8_CHRFK|nr:hypothetical protein GFO_2987 [Christiangramia forsetii KT0803]